MSQNNSSSTSFDNSSNTQDSTDSPNYSSREAQASVGQESAEYDPEENAPISLSYIFGINARLGTRIVNRKPNEHYCIYALAHVASLMNLNTRAVQHFRGHDNTLVSIEHDEKGRFLEIADQESISIWDLGDELGQEPPMKLRILHKPLGQTYQIAAAGMSSCGKYLVVASDKNANDTLIQFWRWSFGHNECDGSFQISEKFGKIRSIRFSANPGENEFFAITLESGVVFAYWNVDTQQLEIHTPEQKKFGKLYQSCYVPGRHTVASVTGSGRIVLWGEDLFHDRKEPRTNVKNFIKMLNVQHPHKIYDIKEIDGMMVTCNEAGQVRFYDVEIRLLYTCIMPKQSSIFHIAPVLVPKEIKLIDADDFDTQEDENVQIVYKSTCPVDYSLEKKPFLVREFYLVDVTGEIHYCNIVKKEFKSVAYRTAENLASFDLLQNEPWVLCAKANENNFFWDYKNYSLDRDAKPTVTCIRKSADGTLLAVGYSNGFVWMMDPITIAAVISAPLRFSKAAILHMAFSSHPALAYADENSSVTLVQYDKEKMEWQLTGKYRSHSKPIVLLSIDQLLANKHSLIALGQDRLCVEYDVEESMRKNALEMIRDEILEQAGEFTTAIVMKLSKIVTKDTSTNGNVILVADNHYKFKIFDLVSRDRLYMFAGPIFDGPIRVIMNFPESNKFCNNMLLFATKKTLGSILLPIDGNIFRYAGITAHPITINMLIPDGTDIFACAEGDLGGTVWSIYYDNVKKFFNSGGDGLVPFCKFIPDGKEGWLFKEMVDMFYYMQIMTRGGDAPEEHSFTDFIPIDDLPDYMRGIGFFPSDYEIQCLLKEATRTTSPSIPPPTTISFYDTVLLYLNHKPVAGYELEDIKLAIEYLASQQSGEFARSHSADSIDDVQISRQRILKMLTTRGEAVSEEMAKRYLIELLSEKPGKMPKNLDINKEFESMPSIFTVAQFCSGFLGIEIKPKSKDGPETVAGNEADPAGSAPQPDVDPDKEADSTTLSKQGQGAVKKSNKY